MTLAPGTDRRAAFEARLGFAPDPFQVRAMDALDAGGSVLVSAPTGSGKTVVADYAVDAARAEGRRAFYTTPLKALSNQKLVELAAVYGPTNVGLLTGDVSIRPAAPVVVMTTEVLRNMLYAERERLDRVGLVVLDEVHFLQDPYRGSVWEEILIVTPRAVRFVCLSATVSNAGELGAWLETVRGPTTVITETRRPVELDHHIALADRRRLEVRLAPLLRRGRLSEEAAALDAAQVRTARRPGARRPYGVPRRTDLVETLRARAMLPAIVFIFSRAACDDAVAQCVQDGLRLTTPEQRALTRQVCERRTEGISDDELRALDYGQWSHALEQGVAAHHAGMAPAIREAVEECFAAGLLQVVYATETLALGVNMPARSVVIERLLKVREHGRSGLTPGEYAQLTGRAGRRGLDVVGHAVTLWTPHLHAGELARLATSAAPDLRSSFRPNYNLAVNLVRRFTRPAATRVLDQSFAQFQSSRRRNAIGARVDRLLALLERWGHVEVEQWRLTARGAALAGIYHESDLLVAEALANGVFDGLAPPELAATVSACTFEARGGARRRPPRLPAEVTGRIAALHALGERLRADEAGQHLDLTRTVDDGFAEAAWRWARRERLGPVLERVELPAGDFVRNVNRLVDLLRQLAHQAPAAAMADAAEGAVRALLRGVVTSGAAVAAAGVAEVEAADAEAGRSNTSAGGRP